MLGVLVATMVIDEDDEPPPGPHPPPLDAVLGILNEKADVEPFLNVYQVFLLYDVDRLVTPLRLLPFSRPPTATTLPPVM